MSTTATCMRTSLAAAGASRGAKPAAGRLPSLSPLSSSYRPSLLAPSTRTLSRRPEQRVVKAQIAQEAFQVADLGGFIGGTAATVFAMTLVGLAIGFVLLRFEALVEEGKIV